MKKLVVAFATVLVASAVLVGGVAASGEPTVVAKGFSCGILDGNGNIFITNNSELLLYDNQQTTKAVLHCSDDGAPYTGPNPPKIFNNANTGLLCGMLQFGITANWSDKVGRRGNSQLTCVQYGPFDGSASSGAGIG